MANDPHDRPSLGGERSETETAAQQRLWTPWRMRYVGGETKAAECIFCDRLAGSDDVEALILLRGDHSFVIMNRYPYNTGHVMIVPHAHVPDPEAVEPEALAEMAVLLPLLTRALRRVLRCDGFNVGMNVGEVAGAGVADHLHEHVVPRWIGDANFMPILASTMVLPELLPVTYAKVRAELAVGTAGGLPPTVAEVSVVVLTADGSQVLVNLSDGDAGLPRIRSQGEAPVWRSAIDRVAAIVTGGAEVVGWSGAAMAVPGEPVALMLRTPAAAPTILDEGASHHRWRFVPIDGVDALLAGEKDRAAVRYAVTRSATEVSGG